MEQKESRIVVKNEWYAVSIGLFEYKIELVDEEKRVYVCRENRDKDDNGQLFINCSFKELIALRDVFSDVVRRIWTHEGSETREVL